MGKYSWGRQKSMMWTAVAIGAGGALVGAVGALLLAPKSGDELRRLLWRFVTRKDSELSLDQQHDAMTNEGGAAQLDATVATARETQAH